MHKQNTEIELKEHRFQREFKGKLKIPNTATTPFRIYTLTFFVDDALVSDGESRLGLFRLVEGSGSSLNMLCCGCPAIGVWKFRGLGSISEPLAPKVAAQSGKNVEGDGSMPSGKNRLGSADKGVCSGGPEVVAGRGAKGLTGPVAPALSNVTLGDGGGKTTDPAGASEGRVVGGC